MTYYNYSCQAQLNGEENVSLYHCEFNYEI